MAIEYGLTPQGFVAKPLSVIQQELNDGFKAILGESAGTEVDGSIPLRSNVGQEITFLADGFGAMWDLLELVVSSQDPNLATDVAQDVVCSLVGVTRHDEEFSSVTATLTGTALTVVPKNSVATVEDTGARFLSQADATLVALTAWINTTGYVVGDRVTHVGRAYVCTVAGTSGLTGPTTTAANITDGLGTLRWNYMGEGAAAVDVAFAAEDAGPIGALAGALNTITTPVSGWKNVTNLLDAEIGQLLESNAHLRRRREQELALPGNSTADAIRANVLEVGKGTDNPVTSCRVFENKGDTTDANGIPPHSVRVVVQGGEDADVAKVVWDSVAAGIGTDGNTAETVQDSEGNNQDVSFHRPTLIPIYITATVRYDPHIWDTADAADLVEQAGLSALLTYFTDWLPGVSVRAQPIGAAIIDRPSELDDAGLAVVPATEGSSSAPGIVEVTDIKIGLAPAPSTGTTLTISPFELATFDSSRITLTATEEAP